MPISKENAARYPKDWKRIRAAILERAGHKCEQCGNPNHWLKNKRTGEITDNGMQAEAWQFADGDKVTLIVLTIAHLDHVPEHAEFSNLRAWCQRCHLAYDHEHHQRNARQTRRKGKAIGELFA